MSATQQNVTAMPGLPEMKELVTMMMRRNTGLNAQAFSGNQNPTTIYTRMVQGSPEVAQYYRELEDKDTTISAGIEMRQTLAMAREMKVQSADAKNGQAERYKDETAAFLGSIPRFRGALREALDAPYYGYTVQEILWKSAGAGVGIEKIVGRPQELFSFGAFADPQDAELRLAQFPGSQGEIVPASKFIVSTHRMRNGDRRGRPLLRRLFWPSWFTRNVFLLHLKFLEKGAGTIAVKYPAAASDDEKTKALEAAAAIAGELYAAISENLQVVPELLDKGRTRDANDFNALADRMEAAMTRMILGQEAATRATSATGSGSRAVSDVQLTLLWEYIANDLADLEETINEQLVLPWGLWTFGPQFADRAFRPYWRADKQPPKDRAAELKLLGDARLMGMEIPVAEVAERTGIRTAEDGEAVLPAVALPTQLFNPGS